MSDFFSVFGDVFTFLSQWKVIGNISLLTCLLTCILITIIAKLLKGSKS